MINRVVEEARKGFVPFVAFMKNLTDKEREELKRNFGISFEDREQIISDHLAEQLERLQM